jgi:selenoprotein W-related protein
LTDKLLRNYKQSIKSLRLIPSKGGCFELRVGDRLIYSKLSTGKFPDEGQMLKDVGKLLGA